MILLLNRETVIFEVLSAIGEQAARQLQCPRAWVEVKLVREKAFLRRPRYFPEITVSSPDANDPATKALAEDLQTSGARLFTLPREDIARELANLGVLARNEINVRLAGLSQ